MCGRYGLFTHLNAIQDYFDAEVNFDYAPRYNITPETDIGVYHPIRRDK
jgi:putative SOS response-associated peptidase YedK